MSRDTELNRFHESHGRHQPMRRLRVSPDDRYAAFHRLPSGDATAPGALVCVECATGAPVLEVPLRAAPAGLVWLAADVVCVLTPTEDHGSIAEAYAVPSGASRGHTTLPTVPLYGRTQHELQCSDDGRVLLAPPEQVRRITCPDEATVLRSWSFAACATATARATGRRVSRSTGPPPTARMFPRVRTAAIWS